MLPAPLQGPITMLDGPDAATLQRGEWFAPLPSAAQRLRDRLWTEVKSA
ncbi:MAG: hypothetical protein JNN08_05200 [Bryobacterales bacterium]|nr:hypothetical protein [Bryobacterales bacterium]